MAAAEPRKARRGGEGARAGPQGRGERAHRARSRCSRARRTRCSGARRAGCARARTTGSTRRARARPSCRRSSPSASAPRGSTRAPARTSSGRSVQLQALALVSKRATRETRRACVPSSPRCPRVHLHTQSHMTCT